MRYTCDLAGERRKVTLDLEYIESVSWRLDLRIVLAACRYRATSEIGDQLSINTRQTIMTAPAATAKAYGTSTRTIRGG